MAQPSELRQAVLARLSLSVRHREHHGFRHAGKMANGLCGMISGNVSAVQIRWSGMLPDFGVSF
jgi:hypothetical protein